jgi:hypothetical protein
VSHDYHEGLPNYNEHQLYFDGCHECKMRAQSDYPFEKVKDLKFAWLRACRFEQGNLDPAELPISETEAPVLRMLWSLIVKLQRVGLPIGLFPGDLAKLLREAQDREAATLAALRTAADLTTFRNVACPRGCGMNVYGTDSDIDSNLRKHLDDICSSKPGKGDQS